MGKSRKGLINQTPTLMLILAGAACLSYLLHISWFKWGSLVVDTFRDPIVVSKLLSGKALYKDIFYEYGFLPPYLLSFICKAFGIHLNVFAGCGVFFTILISLLLYKTARVFLDTIASALVAFTFLFVFAFGSYCYNGIFNFILPYSFASVIFMFWVLFALYLFIKFISKGRASNLLLWCLCMSLAQFSRPDLSVLVWMGFVLSAALLIFKRGGRVRYKTLAVLISPLVVGIFGYLLFLYKTRSFDGFKESIFEHIVTSYANPFVSGVMGIDKISANLLLILKSLFLHLAFLSLLGFGSFGISSFFFARKSFYSLFSGVLIIAITFAFAPEFVEDLIQYRCLPLVLFIGTLLLFLRTFYSRGLRNAEREASLFTLFLISFILTGRIFFNATPNHYGFYTLPVGMICYYILVLGIAKEELERRIKYFCGPLFYSVCVCFFAAVALCWWSISRSAYDQRNFTVRTAKGNFTTRNDGYNRLYWELAAYLVQNTSGNDRLVMIPEGCGVNFFSERENPLRYASVLPPLFEVANENDIISQFADMQSEYIVIATRDTAEYGKLAFGMDYGLCLDKWIKENYSLLKVIGAYPFASNECGAAIFRNKRLPERAAQ